MHIAFAVGLGIASWTSGNMITTWYGTISLKDNDRQRQSVNLTQVREDCEEYRQQLLERPVVGAHEVESHFNSCSPSSSHGSADPWSSSCVVDEISEVRGL